MIHKENNTLACNPEQIILKYRYCNLTHRGLQTKILRRQKYNVEISIVNEYQEDIL